MGRSRGGGDVATLAPQASHVQTLLAVRRNQASRRVPPDALDEGRALPPVQRVPAAFLAQRQPRSLPEVVSYSAGSAEPRLARRRRFGSLPLPVAVEGSLHYHEPDDCRNGSGTGRRARPTCPAQAAQKGVERLLAALPRPKSSKRRQDTRWRKPRRVATPVPQGKTRCRKVEGRVASARPWTVLRP
jgi:hypothetical protein